jgi:predicted DNA-binding transcriptional regulator YafY
MRADRLLKLMLLLQNKGKMTAAALAEELEVSRRTILRDVDALSFAGVPVYTDGGHGGGISLDENYRVKLNGLREAEVQALMVSNNASLLADIGLADAAEQSLLKLLTALPSLHEQSARQFQNRLYIDPVGWRHSEQTRTYLHDVQAAVYSNDVIEIVYQKHDGTRITRRVQPYGLVAKASVWYLIAKHEDMFRSYRISRIKELKLVSQTFVRDADFNLADYWQTSTRNFLNNVPFYTFTLAIHPEQKNFVTWYAPGFCELQGTTDAGWHIGHFYVDNLELAASFVMGLGQKVQILEPEELQEAVAEKIQALIVMNLKS